MVFLAFIIESDTHIDNFYGLTNIFCRLYILAPIS